MDDRIDIKTNRLSSKWSNRELIGRAMWEYFGSVVFALIPRPLWGVRRILLRGYGASIGREAHIFPTAKITIPWNLEIGDHVAIGDRAIIYNLGRVVIGPTATISQGVHLCAGTHDFRLPDLPLLKKPIIVGAGAWICADAYIGPGVVIGESAVVGARAVAVRDVAPNEIVVGNPARCVGMREFTRHK
jgi:putative colanic acid biosynthesis acetyltransferase WcaF